MSKLVRLKPYDPKQGHVIRRYTAFGIRFDEKRGWYRVKDHEAEYLATVRERPGDETAPPAFDVCDEETAARMVTEEVHCDPPSSTHSTRARRIAETATPIESTGQGERSDVRRDQQHPDRSHG